MRLREVNHRTLHKNKKAIQVGPIKIEVEGQVLHQGPMGSAGVGKDRSGCGCLDFCRGKTESIFFFSLLRCKLIEPTLSNGNK